MAWTRGDRLGAAMKARDIPKLSVLAAALGVSESAVSRWRRNGPMTVENVEAICRYLEISADWLLFGRGAMHAPGDSRVALDDAWRRALARLPSAARAGLLQFLESFGH